MTYSEAVMHLHALPRFRNTKGLIPIQALLELLGHPERQLKFIHVAGTNGKGSVCHFCASILKEAGYRCGLFTSPYVSDFRERFVINDRMIPENRLSALTEQVLSAAEQLKEREIIIREFEAVTAVAMLWFLEEKCDLVCLETGLGGKTDATNVIPPPLVSVITPISLDHTKLLGNTVAEIAEQKAGIIKPNSCCVTSASQDLDAFAVLLERCAQCGVNLVSPNQNAVSILQSDLLGSRFRYGGEEYTLSMPGEFQIDNAVTVLEVCRMLAQKGFSISPEAVKIGLKAVRVPARFEVFSQNPWVIADASHNPQAAEKLSGLIRQIPAKRKILLLGMSADKDYAENVKFLASAADQVCCVPLCEPRGLAPEMLQACAASHCPEVFAKNNAQKALLELLDSLTSDDALIVCGSFFLVGELRPCLISYFSK